MQIQLIDQIELGFFCPNFVIVQHKQDDYSQLLSTAQVKFPVGKQLASMLFDCLFFGCSVQDAASMWVQSIT